MAVVHEARMREHISNEGSTDRLRNNVGSVRMTCPECGPDRRKSKDRSLSVKMDGPRAVFFCHHCEIGGAVTLSQPKNDWAKAPEVMPVAEDVQSVMSLSDDQLAWLSGSRSISKETAEGCGMTSGSMYIRSRSARVACIGWQYKNKDGSEATKWRDGAKNFTQTGSARSLWRIDEWKGGDLIICEGELDAMSFEEAGVFATSVPNGAPSSSTNGDAGVKYSYLWDAKDKIDAAKRIILATDSDEPGRLLSEEIARRVGKARCWRCVFPEGCKDANDVLVKHGPEALKGVLSEATPWPVHGLRNVSEFRADVTEIFENGVDGGRASGLKSLDKLFRACPQTLTICTGIPGSGKSAFLTWLSVRLSATSNWQCAIFSAETSTQILLLQLASAFTDRPYMGHDKMSREELDSALDWISSRYVFLDETQTDIESVIERAQAAVLRNGVRMLIVDPYNFLTGTSEGSDDGLARINNLLTSLKSLAVSHDLAIFLVAHPVKMYRQQDGTTPIPTGYSVSGSSAFYNVADAGITLSRVSDGKALFTSWKSRFPWIGALGQTSLDFNHRTGAFSESTDEELDELFDSL